MGETGRPKILVTNDDGYASLGIIALADALNEIGDVTVVAPDHDNSGVGHQVSVKSPVRVSEVTGRSVPTYRCSGTPADCVVIGAFDLCGGMPALIVSGINRGRERRRRRQLLGYGRGGARRNDHRRTVDRRVACGELAQGRQAT